MTLANYPFFAPFDVALDMYPARILLEIIAKLNDAVMHADIHGGHWSLSQKVKKRLQGGAATRLTKTHQEMK